MKGKGILNQVDSVIAYLLIIISTVFFGFYIFVSLSRMSYPFELEWLEGGILLHVLRILEGKEIYVQPSLEFTPFIYGPFYYYISSLFVKIFGVSFFSLRLVSFLCSIGILYVTYNFVYKETNSKLYGLISAGFFLATYRLCGYWFDLARVDTMMLFTLLWGIYLLRFPKTGNSIVLASILLAISLFTKQLVILVIIMMLIYSILFQKKQWPILLFCTGIISFAIFLLLNIRSNGWYYFYNFKLPREHYWIKSMWIEFWTKDIVPILVMVILSIALIVILLKKREQQKFCFYSLFLMGMVAVAWSSRLHSGGWINVLMPALLVFSIVAGIGAGYVSQIINNLGMSNRNKILAGILVKLVILVQFLTLFYNPLSQIPSDKDLLAGEKLVNFIRQVKGEVLIPSHPYLAYLSGKKTTSHFTAVGDVLKSKDANIVNQLKNEIDNAISSKSYAYIIVDVPDFKFESLYEHYRPQGVIFDEEDTFMPVTGALYRPQYIFGKD